MQPNIIFLVKFWTNYSKLKNLTDKLLSWYNENKRNLDKENLWVSERAIILAYFYDRLNHFEIAIHKLDQIAKLLSIKPEWH